MTDGSIDVLMITYRRPDYTRLSLRRLLETCDGSMRVWLWHNGTDRDTLTVTQSFGSHPNVHALHVNEENVGLNEPTNWLWRNATGTYVSKVDDDCLVPDGWAQRLREAHEREPVLGVVGCWRFQEEDFFPRLASRKIHTLPSGTRVLRNTWVQGSSYLMKRSCVEQQGPLRPGTNFSGYCDRLAAAGWINGFHYPFLHEDHMDDPRSPHSALGSDDDMDRHAPLSAVVNDVSTVAEWQDRIRRNAWGVQLAPLDPRWFHGWRGRLYRRAVRLSYHGYSAIHRRAE